MSAMPNEVNLYTFMMVSKRASQWYIIIIRNPIYGLLPLEAEGFKKRKGKNGETMGRNLSSDHTFLT